MFAGLGLDIPELFSFGVPVLQGSVVEHHDHIMKFGWNERVLQASDRGAIYFAALGVQSNPVSNLNQDQNLVFSPRV